jgi:enamine deaminase RidA (YjgF/YER057c/UK114 family)
MEVKRVSEPGKSWSKSVEVLGGRVLYISGQIPVDDDGEIIGPGDVERQSRVVLDKIRQLVTDAGGSLANVVKILGFLTQAEYYPVYDRVRGEFFGQEPPASSTIVVAGLVRPEFLVEVEAVAVLPDR